ncbi:hypothetical protein TYRP_003134 [Tyrophagus putrescentiae]|nr:hypothetical protein TYRP_003134 [Tyrophagus putrescentiae]
MTNFLFLSASLLLLISFTAPQFTSAQFEDLGKGLGDALGSALNSALACAQKIESSGCNSEAEGINLASGELNAPAAGYSQAICCSLKDYGRCVSRQLGEDAQCKDWAGGVATKMEQKFADNCARLQGRLLGGHHLPPPPLLGASSPAAALHPLYPTVLQMLPVHYNGKDTCQKQQQFATATQSTGLEK